MEKHEGRISRNKKAVELIHQEQKARMMLYESLLPLENNPEAEIKEEVVREAGLILFESEGMEGLYDRLLWLFIPKSCNRIIDILWDGIGEWRA